MIPPKIVTLCGSTRFRDAFQEANYRLTRTGNIVLTVGCYADDVHPDNWPFTDETKKSLDVLHKRKIDISDWVYVLNVGGYVGESTLSEIYYARGIGKPVYFLESYDPLCQDCGRDNRNGTHCALESCGHLSHPFNPELGGTRYDSFGRKVS